MLDNVLAVEGLVMDQGIAALAIEELVFDLAIRPASLNNQSEGSSRSAWRMGNVGRNEECVPLTKDMIHDSTVLVSLDDNVALDLVEELFAVGLVEVVSGVGPTDHHYEEVGSAVEVFVANRRLEVRFVQLGPCLQVDR